MPNKLAIKVRDSFNDQLIISKTTKACDDISAIRIWLNEFRDRPNTFTSYRQTAERFLIWCLQNNYATLNNITIEAIHDYQEFLSNPTPVKFWCGPSKPRTSSQWKPFVKALSTTSINLNLRILNSMYEYLVQVGYLVVNPFKSKKSRKLGIVNKSIERYLTHTQWNYVINYIDNLPESSLRQRLDKQRLKWLFELLYLTGCRRHEIASSSMASFKHKHGNWWLCVIGKGNKYGEVPVTNELLQSLIKYRNSIGLNNYPSPNEVNIALINNITNKPEQLKGLSDSMLYKLIKSVCLKVANHVRDTDPSSAFIIEKTSTHWLRHTSATHQVDAGIDIRVVKANLRHSMLETTMKYQHTEDNWRHDETNDKFGINKKYNT